MAALESKKSNVFVCVYELHLVVIYKVKDHYYESVNVKIYVQHLIRSIKKTLGISLVNEVAEDVSITL